MVERAWRGRAQAWPAFGMWRSGGAFWRSGIIRRSTFLYLSDSFGRGVPRRSVVVNFLAWAGDLAFCGVPACRAGMPGVLAFQAGLFLWGRFQSTLLWMRRGDTLAGSI